MRQSPLLYAALLVAGLVIGACASSNEDGTAIPTPTVGAQDTGTESASAGSPEPVATVVPLAAPTPQPVPAAVPTPAFQSVSVSSLAQAEPHLLLATPTPTPRSTRTPALRLTRVWTPTPTPRPTPAPALSDEDEGSPAYVFSGIASSSVWSVTLRTQARSGLHGHTNLADNVSVASFSWRGVEYLVTNIATNRALRDANDWGVVIELSQPLEDGADQLSLRIGDLWLNLADARGEGRQLIWYGVVPTWRIGASVEFELRAFPRAFEPRSVDGYGNNRFRATAGSANTPLIRQAGVSSAYAAAAALPSNMPNPRSISNALFAQSEPTPNEHNAADMLWQWGQFIDHDSVLVPGGSRNDPLPIPVPEGDAVFDPDGTGTQSIPFVRSAFDPHSGADDDNPRQQINAITAFLDGSVVYGSDLKRYDALKADDGSGRMRTSHDGRLLPYNTRLLANQGGNQPSLFLGGDVRANEQLGLTSLHTLFVREHNRLAEIIAAQNPDLTGNEVFEITRKIVGAEIQAITYAEFLPMLLGADAVGLYAGYDRRVDPAIANEFATAAFRLGHSQLSPSLLHIDATGQESAVPLNQAFFNPAFIARNGISGILLGLTRHRAQSIDLPVIDQVRNMLFPDPLGAVGRRDLPALNIQRGRDHGIPDYNTVRRAYGLHPATSFADVTSDRDLQAQLAAVYGDIDRLELWVGGLAEDHAPGAMMGPTFHAIVNDQFQRLRGGDRFWFQNDPFFRDNPALLSEVHAVTLADVIRRNTSLSDEIADSAFHVTATR